MNVPRFRREPRFCRGRVLVPLSNRYGILEEHTPVIGWRPQNTRFILLLKGILK